MNRLHSTLDRIGSERLAGVGVGFGVALAYWAWNTWGQLAMIAAGLLVFPAVALILLYPIIGAVSVAFLVTALPTTMMPKVPTAILLVTLIAVLARKVLTGDLRWRVTPFFVWSSLLLIWLGLSAIWAASYDFIGFANNYYGFLIALVFTQVVRTPADWRGVGVGAALGMLVTAVAMAYGFYELMTTGSLLKMFGGAAGLKEARFYGLWNSPNSLAYAMMAFVALAASLVTAGVRRTARALYALAAVMGLVVIILTLSRGAWLCTAVMLMLMVRYYRKRWLALSAVVLLVVMASFVLPTNMFDRLQTLTHGRRDASLGERSLLIRGGIRMIEESFPFGWGAGATFRYSMDYVPHRLSPIGTHNSYLDALAEGGLIAGVLMAGMIVSLFAAIRRPRWRSSVGFNETSRGILFSGLVAVVAGMSLENVIGFPPYWLYFTLVSLFPFMSPHEPSMRYETESPAPAGRASA